MAPPWRHRKTPLAPVQVQTDSPVAQLLEGM